VAAAQLGAQRFQFIAGRLYFPVGLESELQLAFGADARKAEIVRECHDAYLTMMKSGDILRCLIHERKWYSFINQLLMFM